MRRPRFSSGERYAGAGVCTRGSRPHIHSAVVSWTNNKRVAADVSHAFIWRTPENPSVNSGCPDA